MSCTKKAIRCVKGASPYSAVITREQFPFLRNADNGTPADRRNGPGPRQWTRSLQKTCFNIPLKKSLRGMARVCVRRAGCIGRPGTCAGDCHTVQRRVQADLPVCHDEAVPAGMGLYDYSGGREICQLRPNLWPGGFECVHAASAGTGRLGCILE